MKRILTIGLLLTVALGWNADTWAEPMAGDEAEPEVEISGALKTLAAGQYFSRGSMYARSYRVIARQGERLCLEIVNGPPTPYEGYQEMTVSTVVERSGQAVVTATEDELSISHAEEFVIGNSRLGLWQLRQNQNSEQELSEGLQACLDAEGDYAKVSQGRFIPGLVYPNKSAQLITEQVNAEINVRESPGLQAKVLRSGFGGDQVQVKASGLDETGEIWYQVSFNDSDAEGWIRNDLVRLEDE